MFVMETFKDVTVRHGHIQGGRHRISEMCIPKGLNSKN